MKLDAATAVIPQEKLTRYLLSHEHPIGRFKARFFASLGYTEAEWTRLADDLRSQHLSVDAEEASRTRFGRKFVITAPLTGPNGASASVCSVWIVREGESEPRFVTAYRGA